MHVTAKEMPGDALLSTRLGAEASGFKARARACSPPRRHT